MYFIYKLNIPLYTNKVVISISNIFSNNVMNIILQIKKKKQQYYSYDSLRLVFVFLEKTLQYKNFWISKIDVKY